jgi:hypothetical protein
MLGIKDALGLSCSIAYLNMSQQSLSCVRVENLRSSEPTSAQGLPHRLRLSMPGFYTETCSARATAASHARCLADALYLHELASGGVARPASEAQVVMPLPIMTMIEVKDMAAMEGLNDKLEALAVNLLASQTDIESGMQKRGEIRQVLRMKVVRDGILRK